MVRALASHARGHWFKSSTAHHCKVMPSSHKVWCRTMITRMVICSLALVLAAWAMPVHAQVPPMPHNFYGNLTINGNPAPVGTKVEARGTGVITGIPGNPITTTKEGKYGDPADPFVQRLIVQGDISQGTPIKFYINGVDTGQTHPFQSDEMTRLDLSVTITTATAPTVTTNTATLLTSTSAVLNGNLLNLGTASSVTVSFEWGTTTGYGSETTPQAMSSTGSFSTTLSGLTPATTYHFRAKVVNNNDTAYGSDTSFTTTTATATATGGGGQTSVASKITSQGVITQSVTAKSEDGICRLTIKDGTKALDKSASPLSQITITPLTELPPLTKNADIIGLAYNFGPDGTIFAPPITLEFNYAPSDIPAGIDEEALVIAYYDKDTVMWVELESTVNRATKTTTASISHFTAFAILGYEVEVPSAPAAFTLSSLTISPAEAKIGETVNISIMVANTGGQSANYKVILKINDKVEVTKEVTVPADTSKRVSFSTTRDVAGTYSVDVSGLTGSFTIKEDQEVPVKEILAVQEPSPTAPAPLLPTPPSVKSFNWAVIGGIIGGVVLLAIVISFVVFVRRV